MVMGEEGKGLRKKKREKVKEIERIEMKGEIK